MFMFNSMNKVSWLAICAVSAVVGITGLWSYTLLDNVGADDSTVRYDKTIRPSTTEVKNSLSTVSAVSANRTEHAVSDHSGILETDRLITQLAENLLTHHAHEIDDLRVQVSLKDMKVHLLHSYPADGEKIFASVLMIAFPELASGIMALIEKMTVYDEWLLDNMLDLKDMPPLQHKGTLWDKRYELFGKTDAEKIWQKERDAETERRESMMSTVNMLNDSVDTSMQDRVFILQAAYDENFFGSVEDIVLDSRGVLSQVLFSLDAVQSELAALGPELRQQEINNVRSLLGFEEDQIQWLAERDQERESRWQTGYAYMDERRVVASQYQGEELNVQLDALREKYFKQDANTIKREEEDLGFFRYERQRVFGRN